MASASPGDPAVPPLIAEQLARAGRLVLVATALPAAKSWAATIGTQIGVDIVVTAGHGGLPVINPEASDILVHGIPDIFGRLLPEPEAWSTVVVRDRIAAQACPASGPIIEVGPVPDHDPALLAGALRHLFKPICQQRTVRPIFGSPPPLGLPFIAPYGVQVPGMFGVAIHEDVPGLPDLVVVRPAGTPPAGTEPIRMSNRAMMDRTPGIVSQEYQ